tara:strand:- start:24445 stop:25278 length:834 start_codon:yes stop_codon:yes gene_type:complete
MLNKGAGISAIVAAITLGFCNSAAAEEAAAGSKVSGSFGLDFQSHFISYGADVWGGGTEFFGSQHTTFVYMDIGIELPEGWAMNFGAWSDINNNAPESDSVGGDIQEIDVYGGVSYSTGPMSFGLTYQEWNYGGSTAERILDLTAGFDDSSLWGGGFALNPSLTAHFRVGSDSGAEEGQVIVLAFGPGFEAGPVSFGVPIAFGFVSSEYYGPTADSGLGYSTIGLNASTPLSFIPAAYGAWSATTGVNYYATDADVIPGNIDDEDFTTGFVSLGLSF